MRITIIGGTRFIGLATATRLAGLGHAVTVVHRGETNPEFGAGVKGVRHITLDQTEPGAGGELLGTTPEVILHNIVREPAHVAWVEETIKELRVPLVMTSSMDVYQSFGHLLGTESPVPKGASMGEDAPLREGPFPYRGIVAEDDTNPMWRYDKIPAEELARELGKKYRVPVVLPRLPMVLGPGDPQRRLARFVHSMKPCKGGRLRDRIVMSRSAAAWKSSYGFVENVAALLAEAAVRSATERGFGGVLHAIDGVWSARQVVESVASELGWTGQIIEIDDDDLAESQAEALGMAGGRCADLAFTQPRTDGLLGDYRATDTTEGFKGAISWELEQAPPASLAEVHEAEDGVMATPR